MSLFEKILYTLQSTMKTPEALGWFHLLCLAAAFSCVVFLYMKKDAHNESQLKTVIGIYSVVAFLLELTKQIIWAINYDFTTDVALWDYQWYAAPFQLCTTPIYACLISLFLKRGSGLRKALLSYVAYVTILGSIATMIVPDSCFTSTIVVNIHTMWMHYGSFVVSVYLLMSGEVAMTGLELKRAAHTFLTFIGVATILNIGVYHSGLLNGETFNMFYISPYFISELPVFNTIQQNVPYPVFLLIYITVIGLGSILIFASAKALNWLFGMEHHVFHFKKLHT